ncbi:uncharacterized protein HMPREF1541_10617 [Cyphellophora europaea CBS 101466]|uniref:Threonyl/alanyl tRNA synthetase SAD domain-containing protein n=1 Tax=Cyphellophora europaea (strain CBS 101466) TaxID=1220924 RepID=W2S6V7_CYPE1|nr:uncharacterized protein HMPREF1541_10617 [Cyphellophora europaea CBS 101466]ETN44436.1 hypothetical protein HMPREF1541_10617 [Cyphellophora europaea CBS 101466]
MSTIQVFLTDGQTHQLRSRVVSATPFSTLDSADQTLFPRAEQDHRVVVTTETIFHPQGGGQPSDTGEITSTAATTTTTTTTTAARFSVEMTRLSPSSGKVLHLGRFQDTLTLFKPEEEILQTLDTEKRELYSRYHTAGHTLDAAVRHVCGTTVANFDKLKASHVPGSAACEFTGLIPGERKAAIQARLNELLATKAEVKIEYWAKDEIERVSQEMCIHLDDVTLAENGRCRVVNIEGIDVCPCGGTHVASLDKCGRITVTKISRSNGNSRVSYRLE